MQRRRCFTEGEPLQCGERVLTGRSAAYLTRVLRLGEGDRIVLFDGSGWEFPAEILEVKRRGVRALVADGVLVDRESPLRVWLGLGLCRPATMDVAVRRATELGVTALTPIKTERSQAWHAGQREPGRLRRWERIAQEAARQSGRNRVPRISPLAQFSQVLRQGSQEALRLLFWEEEDHCNLRRMAAAQGHVRHVQVLIGPEGGFTPQEAEEAHKAGFRTISLGPRILRTETAVTAAISLLQYEMGDVGESS